MWIPKLGVGTIAYIPKRKNPKIIGIKLEKPNGDSNGKYKGKRHFKCEKKYGYFIETKELMDIKNKGLELLHYLCDNVVEMNMDTTKEDTLKLVHKILVRMGLQNPGPPTKKEAFKKLNIATKNDSIPFLKQAIKEAKEAKIPPSAPKWIAAQKKLFDLQKNEKLKEKKKIEEQKEDKDGYINWFKKGLKTASSPKKTKLAVLTGLQNTAKSIKKSAKSGATKLKNTAAKGAETVKKSAKAVKIAPKTPKIDTQNNSAKKDVIIDIKPPNTNTNTNAGVINSKKTHLIQRSTKNVNISEKKEKKKKKKDKEKEGYNKKSLRGRVDPGFFRWIQLLFLLENISAGALVAMLIIDSAWAGFPLYIAVCVIVGVVLFDYGVLYFLAWTRWIYQMEIMINVGACILMIQTVSNGYGQILTILGLIFVTNIAVKTFLVYQYKSRLIGKRKKKKKKKSKIRD